MREKDGLAMSSRNVRLDKDARKLAVELSKALKGVKQEIRNQKLEIGKIQEKAKQKLENKAGIELEYFDIRNAETLELPTGKKEKLVALVAAKIGGVRLIDNMVIS
jgi:pantoate--beta-alanine ligase